MVSPAFGDVRLTGEIAYVHGGTPACMTVNVWPATVSVPLRDEVDVFASTLKLTAPLPLPGVPAITVSHAALLAAVHVQPGATATDTEPFVAAAPTEAPTDDNEGAHGIEKLKGFDRSLADDPPGPIAATRASYCTSPGSGADRNATKSTRMKPSLCRTGCRA
jgi:hypothetical protein